MSELHSFGGHALDRHIFDFEAVMDGGGDVGGSEVEGAAEATPDVASGAAEVAQDAAPAAPPAPEINWDAPEVQQRIQAEASQYAEQERMQLLQALAQAGVLQFDQPGLQPPDPLSDNYAAELEAWHEAKLSQTLAPIQDFLAAQQSQQVEGQIGQLISSTAKELGVDGVPDTVVRSLADGFAMETVRQYGQTPQAAQAAVRKAVEFIAADRKAASEAAVTRYRQQIGEIAGTPAEPSGSGGGVHMEPKATTYDEIIARHAARSAA